MPAKSASQFRLMQGIAHGSIKPKGSLTPEKAAEFVQGQSPKGLPEKADAKGRKLQRGRQIPAKKLTKALHSDDPHMRQMANFARNVQKWHH